MLAFNFSPFPEITTERLFLRQLTEADIAVMFALRSDPEVMKFVPRPLAETTQDAAAHIELINSKIVSNEGINWAITLLGKPEMIGIIGHYQLKPEDHRAEIGYMLLPSFQQKGYMSEAIAATVKYGFDAMNLHSIEAIIDPENVASARVLEKNLFVKEAHLRENHYYDGKFLDTVIYSLLKNDYLKSQG